MTYQTFKECIESHLNEGYRFIINGRLVDKVRFTDNSLLIGDLSFYIPDISNIQIKEDNYGYCLTFDSSSLRKDYPTSKNILIPVSLSNNLCEYHEGGSNP